MSSSFPQERQRRASLASKLEVLLKSRPGQWIPIRELAAVGGLGGWRTRLSELARRKDAPLYIQHNGKNGAESCHRYVPWGEPLGRSADVPVPDVWPIDGAPMHEPWRLT